MSEFKGTKRVRVSNETDVDTGSESPPNSPQHKSQLYNHLSVNGSPERNAAPSSPESDLDVDSAPDEATPENLSLKKEDSTSPPNTPLDNVHMLPSFHNNNSQGFIPYHHAQFLATTNPSQSINNNNNNNQLSPHHHQTSTNVLRNQHTPRSPVDVLLRVFPNRRRSDVEQILQRFRGDVLQAMECMLSGEDLTLLSNTNNSTATPPHVSPSPPFPLKSAFSPLVPPVVFGSPTHRYHPFMQAHAKRFLTAPYAGTGYLTSSITSEIDQSDSNGGTSVDRNSNPDSQD